MICEKCNPECIKGTAIDPKQSGYRHKNVRTSGEYYVQKHKDIEIKNCMKCPNCGWSYDYLNIFHKY